jgi:hypothetical protein
MSNLNQKLRQPRHKFTTNLARTGAELEEAQRLRDKVFIEDNGRNLALCHGTPISILQACSSYCPCHS